MRFVGDGKKALKVPDKPELRFGLHETITLEAWVLAPEASGVPYLIGKGRLGTKEFGDRNQNYALRLHEWVIGALAMLPLVLVFQYGPLALLFALSGYVFKHHTHYAPKTPQYFMLVVIGLYGIAVALLSQFTLLTSAIMGASLIMMALLMGWFVRAPKATLPCPAPLAAFLRACSRHTAIIYVAHLMVLGWWMGKAI